jgi:hypothetical protein
MVVTEEYGCSQGGKICYRGFFMEVRRGVLDPSKCGHGGEGSGCT